MSENALPIKDPAVLVDADGVCLQGNAALDATSGIEYKVGERFCLLDMKTGCNMPELLSQAVAGKLTEGHIFLENQGTQAGYRILAIPAANQSAMIVFTPGKLDLAFIDSLTDLPNRRGAELRLAQELSRTIRGNEVTFSIAIADIDHFKSINDRYGHEIGDQALGTVTKRINAVLRKGDWCARWGGEEFVFFLYNTKDNDGIKGCERVRKSICDRPFVSTSGSHVPLAVSIGVVESTRYKLEADDVVDQMLHDADMLMYESKQFGRNRTTHVDAQSRIFWQRVEIREMLRDDGLTTIAREINLVNGSNKASLILPRLKQGSERDTLWLMRSARLQEELQEIENHWFKLLAEYITANKIDTEVLMVPLSSPSLLVFDRMQDVQKSIKKILTTGHKLIVLARAADDIINGALPAIAQLRKLGGEFGLRGVNPDQPPVKMLEKLDPKYILLDHQGDNKVSDLVLKTFAVGKLSVFALGKEEAELS